MKWVLVVMVFGTAPVKTDLVFNTIDECLRAEQQMRDEYSRAYNNWLQWALKNQKEAGYPKSEDFAQKRLGLHNTATCVTQIGVLRGCDASTREWR